MESHIAYPTNNNYIKEKLFCELVDENAANIAVVFIIIDTALNLYVPNSFQYEAAYFSYIFPGPFPRV